MEKSKQEELFIECCKNGEINQLKQLIENLEFELSFKLFEEGFCFGFLNGHLDILKLLYSLQYKYGEIEIGTDEVFIESCLRGYIDIAKWLFSLGIINDKNNVFYKAFYESCRNGHIELAKWLFSLNKKIEINNVVFNCCLSQRWEVVKWLISLQPIYGKITFNTEDKFILNKRLNSFKGNPNCGIEVYSWLESLVND